MLGLYKTGITQDPSNTKGTAVLFSKNIIAEDANEGSPTFSPDGKTMVFARGNNGKKKGTADVDLYMSKLINNEWTLPGVGRLTCIFT